MEQNVSLLWILLILSIVANIIGLEVNLATTTNISIGLSWTILPVGASVSQYEVMSLLLVLILIQSLYSLRWTDRQCYSH